MLKPHQDTLVSIKNTSDTMTGIFIQSTGEFQCHADMRLKVHVPIQVNMHLYSNTDTPEALLDATVHLQLASHAANENGGWVRLIC